MLKKRLVTVFGALLAAAMLVLVAVPADATNYRRTDRSEKKQFKHWLRAQNHDWRRWMHEQKYHWWKWVHEQKHLYYQGDWDANAKFEFPGSGSGNGDTGGTPPPADTGDTPPTPEPPKPRFEMLAEYGDMAVRDNRTGLIWEKSPNTGTVNFYIAWDNCARKNLNGQMGWRIPTTADLTSLVDGAGDGTGLLLLPQGHPFQGLFTTGVRGYWSGTQGRTTVGTFAQPYVVYFSVSANGGMIGNTVGRVPHNSETFAGVWCVSGGLTGPSVAD